MPQLTDDFFAFAGAEHMFFGLSEPFVLIRKSTESMLREQVPDTQLLRIATIDKPKFLTVGRKESRWFRSHVLVTHFGFCVRAELDVTSAKGATRATLDAVLTFLFSKNRNHGAETSRAYVDLGSDVERAFSDEAFERRFLDFRLEENAQNGG